MPLFDHGKPPLSDLYSHPSILFALTTTVADILCKLLPEPFCALEFVRRGNRPFFDIQDDDSRADCGPAFDSAPLLTWRSTIQPTTVPSLIPNGFEVKVYLHDCGTQFVSSVLLVAPTDKDNPEGRRAFISKVAAYLHDGVAVTMLDIVATSPPVLHNAIASAMHWPIETALPESSLFAASYAPAIRNGRTEIDVWTQTFAIGEELPTMPVRTIAGLFVPMDFESPYMTVCRNRRLIT